MIGFKKTNTKKKYLFSALFSVILLCLMGFGKTLDYNYLMTHPTTLGKAYDKCQDNPENSLCPIVKSAVADYVALVKQRGDSPEEYGKHILENQEKLVTY